MVSFANLTLPPDMSALKFEVHGGEDENTKHQRVVMGSGARYVSNAVWGEVPCRACGTAARYNNVKNTVLAT